MHSIRLWIIALMAVSMILTVLSTLLPEGTVKKIAGATGGLVLLLTILQGLNGLHWKNLNLSYEDSAREINRQIEIYRDKSAKEMELLIQQRCAAYISEQAQSMGLACEPQVKTERTDEGVPIPVAVTMNIPYQAALAQSIEENLGIRAANQIWQAAEG